MKNFESYPESYRFETVDALIDLFKKDLNITIAGVKGASKSGLLKFICQRKNIPNTKIAYVDSTGLSVQDWQSFGNALNKTINKDSQFSIENTAQSMAKEMEKIFLANSNLKKMVLILDNFEDIVKANNEGIFKYLKFLYEYFHGSINLVFVINDLKVLSDFRKGLPKDLNPLQNQKIFFIGMISLAELEPSHLRLKINLDSKEILDITGGYPEYLKFLENNEHLEINTIPLCYDIWNSLDTKHKDLIINIANYNSAEDCIELKDLLSLKIIYQKVTKYYVFSDYFLEFLNKELIPKSNINTTPLESNLTKMESKIYNILVSSKGSIVEKETIARVLWGNESTDKYSFWSIDQVVSRLRKKLNLFSPNTKISTIKGRGYTLK